MSFSSKVNAFITRHQLLHADGRYIVALSGGPDSVALLRVLLALGYQVEAAHCNFRLRGKESDRDEQFCVQLCNQQDVTLHRVHFDTTAYAELHHVSIEMAARELRYRYFEQLRQDIHADDICVAHHEDDQAETILLNIIRGTGLRGLQGMQPRNGHIVRPLLSVTRQEVLSYLADLHHDFVTDSTNLVDDAQRNILRLDVLPHLRRINPAVVKNISRMAEHVAEAEAFVKQSAKEVLNTMKSGNQALDMMNSADQGVEGYNLSRLRSHQSASLLLWQLLSTRGFNETQVEEILESGRSGSSWTSTAAVAFIDRDQLCLIDKVMWSRVLPEMRIPETGVYVYGDKGMKFRVTMQDVDASFKVDKRSTVACLDADKVTFPLTIRGVQAGDRFQPFGMQGTRLVSDYLTDRKRSLMDKRQQLVVTDATARILWLVGERVDGRAAVGAATSRVLYIEVLSVQG